MADSSLPTFATFIQLCFGVNTAFAALHEKVCAQVEVRLIAKAKELGLSVVQAPPMPGVEEDCRRTPEELMQLIREAVDRRVERALKWMVVSAFISAAWLFLMDALPGAFWHWVGFGSLLLPVPFLVYWWQCKCVWKEQRIWLDDLKSDFKKASEKSTSEDKSQELLLRKGVEGLVANATRIRDTRDAKKKNTSCRSTCRASHDSAGFRANRWTAERPNTRPGRTW